jgi:4-amino-4-deoxy-L-arabinose transferase-like glycosyltransferase
MAGDPFYDGAARSMGTTWHALVTGAIDPAATVALDKPPGYGWLQVAATKLLGVDGLALHLPAALAGIVAVAALYDALRSLFGRRAAVAGALALAVLPIAVVTSRSDTMDASWRRSTPLHSRASHAPCAAGARGSCRPPGSRSG